MPILNFLTIFSKLRPKNSTNYQSSDQSPENLKTVVTIPENLPLSYSEKSALSKGLNFVPISYKIDKFSVKRDVEKFLLHDKEDDSDTSNKDTFETLQILKSKRNPLEGQSHLQIFLVKKCRHDMNKLKFNRNTKISNLSLEEQSTLKNLKKNAKTQLLKRPTKAAQLLFSGTTSTKKKLCGNFLTSSFMQKLTKISLSLTKTLSKIRLTIFQLNKNCQPLH